MAILAASMSIAGCDREGDVDRQDDEAPTAGAGPSGGADRPNGAVVMREHPLRDPGMNNAVATVVLVPDGWTLEGGLSRPSDRLYNMPVIADVKISAPDGRAVHFFPSLSFEFNQQSPGQPMQPTLGGNLYLPLPESPGQWLMQMAQRSPDPTVSNLRLVAEETMPELTAQLRQQQAATFDVVQRGNATTASMGFGQAFDTQATRLVLQYDQHGRAMEETVMMAWQYLVLVRGGTPVSGQWGIGAMQSLRGPAGSRYLDDPALAAIVQSVRVDPAWAAQMQQYWAELARIKQKGADDRRRQWDDHQRKMQGLRQDIGDIISRGYQTRSAIQARGHERNVDTILEQTPYTTPSGSTVKLPSFYDHVYTDGRGGYILNNDSFYNPNRDPTLNGRNWERIEPSR